MQGLMLCAAAAAPMTAAAVEQLVADKGFPRHLLTMTLFETARMVMAMEATTLALEPEGLRALHVSVQNQVKFATCTLLGMPYLVELPQEGGYTSVAYAMDWDGLKKLMTVQIIPRGGD
ncbi:hypothetical protein Tco_0370239 [Tanacetum coccineum]